MTELRQRLRQFDAQFAQRAHHVQPRDQLGSNYLALTWCFDWAWGFLKARQVQRYAEDGIPASDVLPVASRGGGVRRPEGGTPWMALGWPRSAVPHAMESGRFGCTFKCWPGSRPRSRPGCWLVFEYSFGGTHSRRLIRTGGREIILHQHIVA